MRFHLHIQARMFANEHQYSKHPARLTMLILSRLVTDALVLMLDSLDFPGNRDLGSLRLLCTVVGREMHAGVRRR